MGPFFGIIIVVDGNFILYRKPARFGPAVTASLHASLF
jgi:hypothetical protein